MEMKGLKTGQQKKEDVYLLYNLQMCNITKMQAPS